MKFEECILLLVRKEKARQKVEDEGIILSRTEGLIPTCLCKHKRKGVYHDKTRKNKRKGRIIIDLCTKSQVSLPACLVHSRERSQ